MPEQAPPPPHPAISVIIPVYNMGTYLPRFIRSLQTQSFENFEAVCVNDASTDNSKALLEAWAAGDSRVRVLHLPRNRGAGAARNRAMAVAAGETLCFADPDDVLPPDSLKARYEAYRKYGAVVRGRHERLDAKGYIAYAAPALSGFQEPFCPGKIPSLPVNHFLKAHWTWLFPTQLVRDKRIVNEEGTGTAEDIAFLARLFFHIERCVCVPDVVYYWVERDNSLSQKQYTLADYRDYFATHTIFHDQAAQCDAVNLADDYFNELVFDYINHLHMQIRHESITRDEAEKVFDFMKCACEHTRIQQKYKENLPRHFNGIHWLHTALRYPGEDIETRLERGKAAAHTRQQQRIHELIHQAGFERTVLINKLDLKNRQLNISYQYADKHPQELFHADGQPLVPRYAKDRLVEEYGACTIFERILWLPLPEGGELSVFLNAEPALLCLGEAQGRNAIPLEEIRKFFVHASLDDSGFPPEIRMARKLAQSPPMRRLYEWAWMFIDRDTQADDNAEHLYRWITKNHPEINAFFVLRDDSPDWERLSAEGFRLIPFGSMEHSVLFILAEKLLSSQLDVYIHAYISPEYVSDIRKAHFIYLRHGTVKDDMSPWLNRNDIDLCITSTRREYNATTAPGTRYHLTEKEVVFTGLARHDALLEPAATRNLLLVMPTWRPPLAGKWDGKGQARKRNPDFLQSEYARTWQSFLNNPHLHTVLREYAFHAVFYPHPCMAAYLGDYDFPDSVRRESNATCSVQTLLKAAKVLVTDFSSIAFDMAYQEKPVIYYHTDDTAGYLEGHNWKSGYFDYEKDGFGPICRDERQFVDALARSLGNGCTPDEPYRSRMRNAFEYKDGKCCERIFNDVLAM